MMVTASKQNLPFIQYKAIFQRFLTGYLVFSSQYSVINWRQPSKIKMASNTPSTKNKGVPSLRPKAHMQAYRNEDTILTTVLSRFQSTKNVLVLSMMYRSYHAALVFLFSVYPAFSPWSIISLLWLLFKASICISLRLIRPIKLPFTRFLSSFFSGGAIPKTLKSLSAFFILISQNSSLYSFPWNSSKSI